MFYDGKVQQRLTSIWEREDPGIDFHNCTKQHQLRERIWVQLGNLTTIAEAMRFGGRAYWVWGEGIINLCAATSPQDLRRLKWRLRNVKAAGACGAAAAAMRKLATYWPPSSETHRGPMWYSRYLGKRLCSKGKVA